MKQLDVFPECNVDTNLVSFILGAYVKHKSTCNEVARAVNNSDGFAIGIIDADKRMATLDAGFVLIENQHVDGINNHINLYVHNGGKRFLFTVKPAMDKFILDAAKETGVDICQAGFPSILEDFKKHTKRIQAANDPKLRNLFALIKDCSEMQRLRNTLKYLVNKQYDINLEVVKAFFNGELTNKDLSRYL